MDERGLDDLMDYFSEFFSDVGQLSYLFFRSVVAILTAKFRFFLFLDQCFMIGVESVPIVFITSLFVGMVFAIQTAREFVFYGAGSVVGGVVGIAIIRELGPMITAVVVAGRVGSAMAAEIGTMKVTEQIDALLSMSVDPIFYLVAPRIFACMLMLPLLTVIANLAGVVGGYFVAVYYGGVVPSTFIESVRFLVKVWDIEASLIKAMIFGCVISLIGTFIGLRTKAGARGVGNSTMLSVVISLILIFVFNYFLSMVMFSR